MESNEIRLQVEAPVATITLCRPAKRNALNRAMLHSLAAALDEVEASPARVLIVAAEGAYFCSGGDVAEWSELAPAEFAHQWIRYGHRVFDRLARLRQVSIAAITGHAFGGGLELAAACDFRVLESHAKLALPETGLGVVPGWSGTRRLARRFGMQLVRRMALAGERFSADDALANGMADRIAAPGETLATAMRLAREVAGKAPAAVQTAKLMLAAAEGEAADAAVEALAGMAVADGDELQEGVTAFAEKRAPKF